MTGVQTCALPILYALDQFEGTLVFISHDVYFIRALANKVVHVNAGQLTHYAGDYQYYLDKTKAVSARAALEAGHARFMPSGQSSSLSAAEGERAGARGPQSRKDQKRLEAEELVESRPRVGTRVRIPSPNRSWVRHHWRGSDSFARKKKGSHCWEPFMLSGRISWAN